jgi:hypothetical protein
MLGRARPILSIVTRDLRDVIDLVVLKRRLPRAPSLLTTLDPRQAWFFFFPFIGSDI